MKFLKKFKKGFTLVELVVVIAVIAILAAISVVSYTAITKRAKESNDHMVIDQVNTVLKASNILDAKPTVHEILENLDMGEGYDIREMKPELKDTRFVYSFKDNKFGYWKDSENKVVYPADLDGRTKDVDLWFIEDAQGSAGKVSFKDGASHYLRSLSGATVVDTDGGLDVGNQVVNEINFARTVKSDYNVLIRTNNKTTTLNINAPKDTVKHFGAAGLVDIISVASTSYHEHGDISLAKIANGRVVVTEDAKIEGIHATATSDSFNNISIAVVGHAELPSISRDKISIDDKTEQGVYSQLILEVQTLATDQSIDANPEYVWVSVTVDGSGNVEKTTEVASSKEVLSEESIIPASSQSSAASVAAEESKETSTFIDVANADELNSAVAMNTNSIKIRFLDDIEISSYLDVTKSTSIFGQGHKLTSTAKRVIGINDVSNVSVDINNLDLILKNNERGDKRGINLYGQDSSLSLTGCTVKNFYEDNPLEYAINIPGNNGLTERLNVSIVDSYVVGWAALNTYASDSSFVIKNSTLHGINTYSGTSNSFATIVFDGGDLCYDTSTAHHSRIALENSIIIAEERTEQTQSWISFQYGAENNAASVSIDPKTRILDAVDGENKISTFYMTGLNNSIIVYLNGIQRAEILAKGYLVTDNPDGSSTITPNTADFVWYSNGAFTTNKEDAAGSLYASFATPFLDGWMASGEGIMLFKDIVLQNDVACNVTSGTIYLYLDGHSISGGKLLLSGSVNVVSDSADLSSVLGGGSILKVDNPNGTYTYSLQD